MAVRRPLRPPGRPLLASPAAASDDLLLKVTPPRVPRGLLARERLQAGQPQLRGAAALLVQAPAGYGKTSLLAQWRREQLAQGDVVAWLSAQPQDTPARLVQALTLALRLAAGRPGFGQALLQAPADGLEGITGWLAELAQSALNVLLIVDEAERLPAAGREALAYLLRNAPANLRVAVAARTDAQLEIDDLVAYGHCLRLGAAQLRFQLDETLALVRQRFGAQFDADGAARLHELTEGWPLGLQLALSLMASGADAHAGLDHLAAQQGSLRAAEGELRAPLVNLLLANLDPADARFLARIALLDHLHPALCEAVTAEADAPQRLARLARDTPVFAAAELGDWLRLHALAHEVLRERFAALPADERALLHARAADWLAAQGQIEAAARHALAAGRHEQAYELAERSLYQSLMGQGRRDAVLDWLQHLPPAELDRRPRLLLAAAWTLALSERHDEAGALVARLLAQPAVDDALRCECALILGGAAVFADLPDRFAELHDPWAEAPPLQDAQLLQVHANRRAFRALLDGDPALARLRQQQAPRAEAGPALAYVRRWSDFIVALSYLWEGQARQAEALLRPTLARAEAELGRRSPFACMLAALLAAALWERDRPAEAGALLANRLDVLERHALPEAVLLGYRTMARMAIAEGAEHRALELLGAMEAVGRARTLPRLRVAALVEQVRLHARRFRSETCEALCRQIDALLAEAALPAGPLWRRGVLLLRDTALAHAALAAQDWRRAITLLQQADAQAQAARLGRLHIELLGLRALALDRVGERAALPLLREAADLAQGYGLARVFADAHPALGDWVQRALREQGDADAAGRPGPLAAPLITPPAAPRVAPSMALTPKEREVLALLARSLSNKEIGLAMQVGEETIKWHMKNLFAKLDAGTRKQVVQRARILGLLDT
ncbi:LuxR C-terminal-related transcriptional regulator [Aquabacterium sp.]|uniref:helix-turn-helix transcriptional regulator n=1 Tax=Aquabacterium sp. TaxID=1872578 RepID=UPI0037835B0F